MSYTEGMSIMLSPSVSTDRDGSEKLTASQLLLKQMVLNSVTAANTRRNYSRSLDRWMICLPSPLDDRYNAVTCLAGGESSGTLQEQHMCPDSRIRGVDGRSPSRLANNRRRFCGRVKV